jgi:hypothetical protein
LFGCTFAASAAQHAGTVVAYRGNVDIYSPDTQEWRDALGVETVGVCETVRTGSRLTGFDFSLVLRIANNFDCAAGSAHRRHSGQYFMIESLLFYEDRVELATETVSYDLVVID